MVLDVRPQDSSGLDLQRSCAGADDAADHGDDRLRRRVDLGSCLQRRDDRLPAEAGSSQKLLERIREVLEIDRQARAVAAQRAVVVEGIARLTSRER
jgi:hypothetical protein